MVWEELAHAFLPDGDRLTLRRCGGEFEIRFNLVELMSSRGPVSEQAMAKLACRRIGRDAHVLIGGLGMGYTVRAVLDAIGPGARVTVAELVPEVIAWNRGALAHLACRPLDDPRVTVVNEDVARVIRPCGFDAILMDVDNGPQAVLFPANRFLYEADGVRLIVSGLRPGGVFVLWAADPSPGFERAVAAAGYACERRDITVPGETGVKHTIYLVQRGA